MVFYLPELKTISMLLITLLYNQHHKQAAASLQKL